MDGDTEAEDCKMGLVRTGEDMEKRGPRARLVGCETGRPAWETGWQVSGGSSGT